MIDYYNKLYLYAGSIERLSSFAEVLQPISPEEGLKPRHSSYRDHAFNCYSVLPVVKAHLIQLAKELRY